MSLYFENYNTGDLELIKKQLNSKEVFICGIYKKCKYGFPQIILLNPVKHIQGEEYLNYEAVSNILWLTCPYLNNNIHELENASHIKKIKTIIQNSAYFTNMMLRAHADYYYMRNFIFQKYARSELSIQGREVDFSKTGIGGMRDLSAIKCLHLHYCHYNLCKDNIAGLITFKLLNKKTDCDDAFCICYK
jgi:uncharacterized protein